jgi:hypothetical protein
MDVHIWIMIQIGIDFILMVLLLGYLRSLSKRQLPWQEYEEVVKRSEAILTEMKQISLMLEKNLNEKREISLHLLAQLDQGLAKAQASCKKIQELQQKHEDVFEIKNKSNSESDPQFSIQALYEKGLTKAEIANQLSLPLGEVELFLKLHPKA